MKAWFLGVIAACALNGAAAACAEKVEIGQTEAEELLGVLGDAQKSSLSKNAAIDRLLCSKDFSLRRIAVSEGLRITSDKFARQKLIFSALSGMTALRLDPVAPFNPNGALKEGERLTISLNDPNSETGCIGVQHYQCGARTGLWVRSDRIEYRFSDIFADLQVVGEGELIGFLDTGDKKSRSSVKGQLD